MNIKLATARSALCHNIRAADDRGKLFRPGQAQVRAGKVDAGHCFTQIVIMNERLTNQVLKLFVLENFEPFRICQRLGIGCRIRVGSIRFWRFDLRSLIFLSERKALRQAHN